jgi:hypothetical protein
MASGHRFRREYETIFSHEVILLCVYLSVDSSKAGKCGGRKSSPKNTKFARRAKEKVLKDYRNDEL